MAMEPAHSIIRRLGGEAVVATITGTASTAPYRWQYPRDKGGTGGIIPQRHHLALLDYANAVSIALTPSDFLPLRAVPSKPGEAVTAVSINAPCIPSSDSTAGHSPASSTHPIHETSGSPAGECGQGCGVDR